MSSLRLAIATLAITVMCAAATLAQDVRAPVTASAASDRVRFSAPNRVAWLRLEVLSADGEVLFLGNSRGSVIDWSVSDAHGSRLADGSYLCVVTVKDVGGRPAQRLTVVDVMAGVVTARPATPADLTARQAEAVGPVEYESAGVIPVDEAPAAALLAHDGREGQLVTTAGDLSFRGGDFFTGRDKELMRLSQDGSLEVTGSLLARGGIRFADGTVMHSAASAGRAGKGAKSGSLAVGEDAYTVSSTVGKLAKFSTISGAVMDSGVAESTTGNLGVGVAPSTTARLSIASPARVVPLSLKQDALASAYLTLALFSTTDGTVGQLAAGMHNNAATFLVGGTAARNFGFFANNSVFSPQLFIRGSDGNVGVGTTSPAHKLDVAGSLRVAGAGNGLVFPDGTKQLTAAVSGVAGTGAAGALPLWSSASALTNSVITQSGGNVGIGVASPSALLDVRRTESTDILQRLWNTGAGGTKMRLVAGTGATTQVQMTDTLGWLMSIAGNRATGMQFRLIGPGDIDSEATLASSARVTILPAGNVGIGTTAPAHRLDVVGNVRVAGTGNGLVFPDGTKQTTAAVRGLTGTGAVGAVPLWTGSSALSNSSITQASGNVAMAGNLTVTGSITGGNVVAKFQDVAEWVPGRGDLPAGTVVVVDRSRTNGVVASSRSYSTHVAGVVSPQPGLILGEGGPGQVLVATTGRVRVKVDATRSPIRVGDLLVTGGAQGTAMRSVPVRAGGARLHRPGTIVGKALEPLAKGTGEILVLLSLQ